MAQDSSEAAKARAVVASLLTVEAVVIAAVGVWLIVLTIKADSFELSPLLGEFLFVVLGSAGLAASAAGYRRGKYFGRAPAVLANLIALGVVSYQVQAGFWLVAIPLAALAIATLVAALRAIPE